jgi:hypothetical protein
VEAETIRQELDGLKGRLADLEAIVGGGRRRLPEFEEMLSACTPRALALCLRGTSLPTLAGAFYGAGRERLLQLKEALSRNTWAELLEHWTAGVGAEREQACQYLLRKRLASLLELGEIANGESGMVVVAIPESGGIPEEQGQAILARHRIEAGRRQVAAKKWLKKELGPDFRGSVAG